MIKTIIKVLRTFLFWVIINYIILGILFTFLAVENRRNINRIKENQRISCEHETSVFPITVDYLKFRIREAKSEAEKNKYSNFLKHLDDGKKEC